MAETLVSGDPFRPPGLRREVPLAVLDPFVRLAHGGARQVARGAAGAGRATWPGSGPSGYPQARARLPSGLGLGAR